MIVLAALVPYQAKASRKAQEEAENAAEIEAVETANMELYRQAADVESVSPYADGTYEGTAEGFGGPIRVKVTIKEGDIEEIEVLEASGEDPTYFEQAQTLLEEILLTQGVEVDTVSGATFSSEGLIHAVTEALRKAMS